MTKKVFWDDPYLTELEAVVAGVQENDIHLDRTIFYAESGGQESDHGSIAGRPVLRARKQDQEIVYALGPGHGLRPGDPVTVKIDWERRYRLMRLHFAAEVILALVYRMRNGAEKIGAHIAPDKARIDFKWEGNISALFPELEKEAGRVIRADLAIVSAFSDETAGKRYWQVEGFPKVPCGGTHLKRTGEIGTLALKRNNIGKGKERIEIYIDGDPA